MAQATTFNIQLKTKEDIGGGREASYGGCQEKHSEQV